MVKWFFSILIVGVVVQKSAAITDLATFLNLMTSLKYNQPCSWTNEEARQNLTRVMSTTSPRFGGSASFLISTINRFSSDVIANRKQFCAAPELLICDKDSERCVCGDPGKQVVLPNTDSTLDYVVERDENGVNRCRWAENSYCISDDIFRAQGYGSMINSKCRSGTSCIAKAGGRACSFHSLVMHMFQSSRGRGGVPNLPRMMRDMYEGKVCTCKADPSVNEISSDEDLTNDIRRKRSIVDDMTEQQQFAGFVAPVLQVGALYA